MGQIKYGGVTYSGGGSSAADDVTYDNTDSGLTATNVQDAIDELVQGSGSEQYVEYTIQSGDTFRAALNALYALIDTTKISTKARLIEYSAAGEITTYWISNKTTNYISFTYCSAEYNSLYIMSLVLNASTSKRTTSTNGSAPVDGSTTAASPSYIKYRLYY